MVKYYKAGYRRVPLTELFKKGKLEQNDPPLPKILFCVIYRPILQVSAHTHVLMVKYHSKAIYRLIR